MLFRSRAEDCIGKRGGGAGGDAFFKDFDQVFELEQAVGFAQPASGKAARMVSAGMSATMPPMKALMMRLKTTWTRASERMSIRLTARTTGFMVAAPVIGMGKGEV